jgi:hypothetical protein
MTRAELSKMLYELDVPPSRYRLDGTHLEQAFVLAHRDGRWVVFLSERGGESGPVEFDDEELACVHFFGSLCADLYETEQLRVIATPPSH